MLLNGQLMYPYSKLSEWGWLFRAVLCSVFRVSPPLCPSHMSCKKRNRSFVNSSFCSTFDPLWGEEETFRRPVRNGPTWAKDDHVVQWSMKLSPLESPPYEAGRSTDLLRGFQTQFQRPKVRTNGSFRFQHLNPKLRFMKTEINKKHVSHIHSAGERALKQAVNRTDHFHMSFQAFQRLTQNKEVHKAQAL